MQEKDPTTYSLITYGWVFFLAFWGGLANYLQKYRLGLIARKPIVEFVIDIVIAGLAGIVTFFLCEFAEIPQTLTASMVGISGHMGARGLFLIERMIERRITRI